MARLLVVDDDSEQVAVRKLLLEASGYQVTTATTAPDAMRLLAEFQPDILLMDLRLPQLRDGLALIRSVKEQQVRAKIVVLSGWTSELEDLPEEKLVAKVLLKPIRTHLLLGAIRELIVLVCCFLLAAGAMRAQHFPLRLERPAEVVADLEMASPGSNWAQTGREAALATLTLDEKSTQDVMLYAGESRYTYSAFLGQLSAGEHRLRIGRNPRYSASGSGLEVGAVHFRRFAPGDPYWPALAHAPILFARADTVGGYSDVPLLSYCERLTENGRSCLQYTVIFSNEDGGTSTRVLMARWGRSTDIEYIYKAWRGPQGKVERATIQAKGHKEVAFRGRRDGTHPLLIPSTRNNMVAPGGFSPIRYQIPPLVVDLAAHSREQVMDEHPITYRVMSQELAREGKLRPFGTVEGEKISDPRNYLYLEAEVTNRCSALAALVRLQGESVWRSSHLGHADYAIARDGWVRTTVELPPGTKPGQIAELGWECLAAPSKPPPLAGLCRLEAVSKVFFLDPEYRPGPDLWTRSEPVEIPTGQVWVGLSLSFSAAAFWPARNLPPAAW